MGVRDLGALVAAIVVFIGAISPVVVGEIVSDSLFSFEWKYLARSNFSSEIRVHPHLLLLVTVPWSGESRALMREITQLAVQKHEKFGQLKLMFVYRNIEKTLADVLGATKGISFFCYHHSVAFKYQGRLRAQNILMSAYYLMLLPPNELPFRQLNTESDLQAFLQSTDKSVLLFEFCGWTQMLLAKWHGSLFDERGTNLHTMSSHSQFPSDDAGGEQHITNAFAWKEDQKGSNRAQLSCGVENGHDENHWFDEFTFTNMSNSSVGAGTGDNGFSISCAHDEFQRYESFFSMLVTLARENFLPPERLRYGLISRRDLLLNLGMKDHGLWLLLLHFIGCPNCSMTFREGDDLKSMLLMHHPLMVELEEKGLNLEPAFPANRPSIILFVDRSSKLSKVRKRSTVALEMFRKLALQSQQAFWMADGMNKANTVGLLKQITPKKKGISPDSSKLVVVDVSQASATVASLLNKDKSGRLDRVNTHGQTSYEILLSFLRQKNPSVVEEQIELKVLSDHRRIEIHDTLQDTTQNGLPFSGLSGHKSQGAEVLGRLIDEQVTDQDNLNLFNNIRTEMVGEQSVAIGINDAVHLDTTASNSGNTNLNFVGSILGIMEDQITGAENKIILEDFSIDMRGDDGLSLDFIDCTGQIPNFRYTTFWQLDICPVKTLKDFICFIPTAAAIDNSMAAEGPNRVDNVDKLQGRDFRFDFSFFFSDGGYQSLKSLTGESRIPSLIILDPVKQQHYVFPEVSSFSYSTIINFVSAYLNGSLASFQHSEIVLPIPLEVPYPTFVNQEIHQAGPIPFISARELSDTVLGDNHNVINSATSCVGTWIGCCSCKKDVVVLFSNSWCGFCRRMELVVDEVYHAFRGYESILQNKKKLENAVLIDVPSFFRMDCTLNDCSSILNSVTQSEFYPSLVLFPAEKRHGISYEGGISVSGLIEFILSYGNTTHHISRMEGILWRNESKLGKASNSSEYSSSQPSEVHLPSGMSQQLEVLLKRDRVVENRQNLADLPTSAEAYEREDVRLGSVLTSNDNINIPPPFDKSKIVIVRVDQYKSFQGLIFNKRLQWDILRDLGQDVESLKAAPLSYGGPIVIQNASLVSLSRNRTNEGYSEIWSGFSFGDQHSTGRIIDMIKSGNRSAVDFWFFLGYASWEWEQLYNELAHKTWHLDVNLVGQLKWPGT